MNRIKSALIAIAVATASTGTVVTLSQAAHAEAAATLGYNVEGSFVRKSKKLKGSWDIVERDGKSFIVFDEDFRAAGGPDLKVFLSPKNLSEVTGKTATQGSINLGELVKTKGVQEYEIPADIDLAAFGSVLVHCEAYSVLWGGSDL